MEYKEKIKDRDVVEKIIKVNITLKDSQKDKIDTRRWIFTYKGEKTSSRFRHVEFLASTLNEAIASFSIDEVDYFTISNKY